MFINNSTTKSVICLTRDGAPIGSGVIINLGAGQFICTCKHVVGANPNGMSVDHKSLEKNTFKIYPEYFKCHKDADIAISPINSTGIMKANSDVISIPENKLLFYKNPENPEFSNLGLGDTIFALGFPLQLRGKSKNYPILRGGFIARLDKECIEQDKCFWIDSNIFPGNSGGPVFLKPELNSVGDTTPITQGYLLGIVSSYIPYKDALISKQTGDIVSTTQEHSGLSLVVPIHYAMEIYDEHFAALFANSKA